MPTAYGCEVQAAADENVMDTTGLDLERGADDYDKTTSPEFERFTVESLVNMKSNLLDILSDKSATTIEVGPSVTRKEKHPEKINKPEDVDKIDWNF